MSTATYRDTDRRAMVRALVRLYDSSAYRLLTDLADELGISVAYVDRLTVQAHLECDLTDDRWAQINASFAALEFDTWVGDSGDCRTAWINAVLDRTPHTPVMA